MECLLAPDPKELVIVSFSKRWHINSKYSGDNRLLCLQPAVNRAMEHCTDAAVHTAAKPP